MSDMNVNEEAHCTVCFRTDAGHHQYGHRHFCDEHLAAFSKNTPSLWRTALVSLFAAILPAIGLGVTAPIVLQQHQIASPWIIVILAAIPSLIWLFSIYRIAKRSALLLTSILPTVFLGGALVATAISHPILYDLIRIDVLLGGTTASNRFLIDILVQGFFHSFLLYALVRYSVWNTPMFTQRSDGVLFALSAAWGYSPLLVILTTFGQGQIALQSGSLFVATRLLAYVIPAPIVGFFLGRNRFEDMPIHYLSSGIMLGAFLCGLTLYASTELNNTQFNLAQDGYSPWPGLVFSIVVSIAVLAGVAGLMTRHNSLTRSRLHLDS